MPDRGARVQWSQAHRRALVMVKIVLAILALVLGGVAGYFGEGLGQMFGIAIFSVGAWHMFPDMHPILSNVVDRLPFLASKTEGNEGD